MYMICIYIHTYIHIYIYILHIYIYMVLVVVLVNYFGEFPHYFGAMVEAIACWYLQGTPIRNQGL